MWTRLLLRHDQEAAIKLRRNLCIRYTWERIPAHKVDVESFVQSVRETLLVTEMNKEPTDETHILYRRDCEMLRFLLKLAVLETCCREFFFGIRDVMWAHVHGPDDERRVAAWRLLRHLYAVYNMSVPNPIDPYRDMEVAGSFLYVRLAVGAGHWKDHFDLLDQRSLFRLVLHYCRLHRDDARHLYPALAVLKKLHASHLSLAGTGVSSSVVLLEANDVYAVLKNEMSHDDGSLLDDIHIVLSLPILSRAYDKFREWILCHDDTSLMLLRDSCKWRDALTSGDGIVMEWTVEERLQWAKPHLVAKTPEVAEKIRAALRGQ
jgi:hypothetical protein